MPYEYYNPQKHTVACTLPFGRVVKVAAGQYVPTMTQEDAGITYEVLADFVKPGFLQQTPLAKRRELQEEAAAKMAETAVLGGPLVDSFGGEVGQSSTPPNPAESVSVGAQTNRELGASIQAAIDKKTSSFKAK